MTVIDYLADLLHHVPVREAAKLAVIERLGDPHRHYHTLEHVVEMWRWHTEFNQGKFVGDDHQIIASFCLYHDAVYDPCATDNEQESGDLWLADSVDMTTQPIRMTVDEIIFATADHFNYRETRQADLIYPCLSWCIDLDLLRLGSEQFTQHGRAIRAEYMHLSDQQWIRSSAAFRSKVMAQSRIFSYPQFGDMERRARRNLASALMQDWRELGYL